MTKSNTKKARLHSARKQRAAAPAPKQEAQPRTRDEIYEELARAAAKLIGRPRRCRDKACRRTRRCVGPDYRCGRDAAAEPLTPEQEADFQVMLREGLQKRLAQFQAGRGEQPRRGSRPASW